MTTKNYCYGATAPTGNLQSVRDQMHAAHKYRNRLCELERVRRDASEAVIRRLSPEYARLAAEYDLADAAVNAAYDAIKKDRAKSRTRVAPTESQATAIREAKTARANAAVSVKAHKAAAYADLKNRQSPYMAEADRAVPIDTDIKPATRKQLVRAEYLSRLAAVGLDAGQLAYARDQKQARADCGCYWGTYLTVEDAAKDFGKGPPPAFKSWTGDGTIGVQLMGGLSVEDAIAGNDTRLRIELRNEEELATKGWSRYGRAVGTAYMRIGSNPDRSPIWAEVPVSFDRPLPRGGDIRWAYLHRRHVARSDKWQLRLTINEPPAVEVMPSEGTDSKVALHLGWRMLDDGALRTAVWFGSDGRQGQIAFDANWLAEDSKVESVQSERDIEFDFFKPYLLEWLLSNAVILPEWMRTGIETISQWNSLDRFARLSVLWRSHRFGGDQVIFDRLDQWRKWDTQQLQHQERLRSRLIARRNDLYRCTLKMLANEYGSLVLAKIDWKKLAEKEKADEAITQTRNHRHNARMASPGLMSQLAGEYFAGRVVAVAPENITLACNQCGNSHPSLDRSQRMQTCSNCHAEWDQDHNAVRNQMAASARVPGRTAGPLVDDAAVELAPCDAYGLPTVETPTTETPRKSRRNRRSPLIVG